MNKRFKLLSLLSLVGFLLAACQPAPESSSSSISSREVSQPSNTHRISSSTQKTYTVIWKNYDGSVLEVDYSVLENATPIYDGVTPVKPSDEDYDYKFAGWSPTVLPITSNTTYTACFNAKKIPYVIDFELNGGTSPSYQGALSVEEFNENIFFYDVYKANCVFRGWSYNGAKIFDEKGHKLSDFEMQKEMTFTAIYSQTVLLNLEVEDENAGYVTGEGEYAFGATARIQAFPKQGYKFVGWYRDNVLYSDEQDYACHLEQSDLTLVAKFEPDYYRLTAEVYHFQNDFGQIGMDGDNEQRDSIEILCKYLSTVKLVAHTKISIIPFLGWFDENNNRISEDETLNFVMVNNNYTLTAKWNFFSINYNGIAGTYTHNNPTSYTYDDEIVLTPATREGYTFLGWKDTNTGKMIEKIERGSSIDYRLEPVFNNGNVSHVNLYPDGGTVGSHFFDFTYDSYYVLPIPTKNGYKFLGWYRGQTLIPNDGVWAIDSEYVSLTAHWELETYYITYDLNGGTDSTTNPRTYNRNSEAVALQPITKDYYNFAGWEYNGEIVDHLNPLWGANVLLKATWTPINYRINYSIPANTTHSNPETYNIEQEVVLKNASRPGYTFLRWVDSNDTSKTVTKINLGSHGDVYLTAVFDDGKYYQVSFDSAGGSYCSSITVQYGHVCTLPTPTRSGYQFMWWFSEKYGPVSSGSVWNIPEDVTLTAEWRLHNISNIL